MIENSSYSSDASFIDFIKMNGKDEKFNSNYESIPKNVLKDYDKWFQNF